MKGFYGQGKIIAGIDISLRGTGIVVIDENGNRLHEQLIDGRKIFGMPRMKLIRDIVFEVLEKFKVDVVAVEGFSFGSGGRSVFELGGIGYIIRLGLFDKGYKFYDVSPSSCKAFIIKGNADKLMMQYGVEKLYGIYFEDDNLCDAYALSRMLLAFGDEILNYTEKGGADKIKKLRLALEKEGKKLL
jgi:crossover junction endodeoxyribonuclease RuvC